jgi:hypothetical protein
MPNTFERVSDLLFLPHQQGMITAGFLGNLQTWNLRAGSMDRFLGSSPHPSKFGFDTRTNRILRVENTGNISSLNPISGNPPRWTELESIFPLETTGWGITPEGRYVFGKPQNEVRHLVILDLWTRTAHRWVAQDEDFQPTTVRMDPSGRGYAILALGGSKDRPKTRIYWKAFDSKTEQIIGTWDARVQDTTFLRDPQGKGFLLGLQEPFSWQVIELDPENPTTHPILAMGEGKQLRLALSSSGNQVAICYQKDKRWWSQLHTRHSRETRWSRDLGRKAVAQILVLDLPPTDRILLVRYGEDQKRSAIHLHNALNGEEVFHFQVPGDIETLQLDPNHRYLLSCMKRQHGDTLRYELGVWNLPTKIGSK